MTTKLTPRERQVTELVAEGLTNAEIAERLIISEHTVKVYMSNIMGKMDMRNRVELAVWWVRQDANA